MEKVRKYESRLTTFVKDKVGNDEGSRVSTQSSAPGQEGWKNLIGLLETLDHVGRAIGIGQVKATVEEFASCIGIYEGAAKGRKDYDELREQLEGIFEELKRYISLSPDITPSVENICGSIRKEVEYTKSQQNRSIGRRLLEAVSDADNILRCYQRIKAHLERLTRNVNTSAWVIVDPITTENRLRELAPSLWACYNSEKAPQLKRRSCTEGTRTNLLAQMHQWVASKDTENIYWMSGMAGTGKTTIAYSLCEQLDTEANRLLCASFFCSRFLPECRNVGRIIPSIAYQLARFSRPFRYALAQSTEKNPIAPTKLPHKQFESLIEQPFSYVGVGDAFPTNTVVVIDALDECDGTESTKQILDVLLAKSKDLPIKFVVSSRPEPAIRDQMEKNGAWVDARVVLHELDTVEVRADIRTYIEAELEPIVPSKSEVEQLVARAGSLFIYAATVVRYIGYDDFGQNPRGRLRAVLAKTGQHVKVPKNEIDELYGIVLDAAFKDSLVSSEEQRNTKLILHTLICAREPLTVVTLNELLQLDDVHWVREVIRQWSSVLHVTGPDMTIMLLHASFLNYLLNPQRSGAWHTNFGAGHHLLAQLCFKCIGNTKPQFNICRLESSYLLDSEVSDLDERAHKFISTGLRYACQYWFSHLDAAESSTASQITPLLSYFLTTHLLLWMEVKNLTKTVSAAISELTAAKQWAIGHGITYDVIALLSDAWRFASTFVSSPISQSTPHIYISMLPLLPSSSLIRRHYLGRFRGITGATATAVDRRKDALLAQWKVELSMKCLSCSSNGHWIAIGGKTEIHGGSDRVCMLDAFSGKLIHDLSHGDKATVNSIAFSSDCTHLITGRSDGVILVWNAINGQPVLGPFKAHNDAVRSILFSHDGSYIVSASNDTTIRIWNVLSGEPALVPLIGHTDYVTCIAISLDDERLVSGSSDRTIRVWDVQSGQLLMDPITGHENGITSISLSPDDSYIVSGSGDSTIRVWNSHTGQMMLGPLRGQGDRMTSVSISPDGTAIASASNIDGIRVWDTASGKIEARLGSFSNEASLDKWATYSPDGTRIIFASDDRTIKLLDANTAITSDPSLGRSKPITSVDISPNGQYLVSGSFDYNIYVWELSQGVAILGPLQGHTDWVNMVRFSRDGSRIVSCSEDSTIRQWDVHTGEMHGPIEVTSAGRTGVVSVGYSPDRADIVSLVYWGGLLVRDSSSGQCKLGPVTAPSRSIGIHAEFSSDGTTVIAGYKDGSIGVWDAQNGQMLVSHRGNEESNVLSLALSPDGLYYAQSFSDGKIRLRNFHTGEKMSGSFEGHTEVVRSMRFSPDGTRLASGSHDKTVHVWDVETGQSLLGPLQGHTDWARSVAFSPDGKSVVSASSDATICVWDVQPNKPSSKGVNNNGWKLNEDGWVVSGESQRLLWVPSHLRLPLTQMPPRNKMLFCRNRHVRLNFEDPPIGEAWVNCWRDS